MPERYAFICVPCTRTKAITGLVTTEACVVGAKAHGCYSALRPKGKKGKALVKFVLPRNLTAEQWRTVWNSLDRPLDNPPICRSKRGSCGHAESSHLFSSVTSPFCKDNCQRCQVAW